LEYKYEIKYINEIFTVLACYAAQIYN